MFLTFSEARIVEKNLRFIKKDLKSVRELCDNNV